MSLCAVRYWLNKILLFLLGPPGGKQPTPLSIGQSSTQRDWRHLLPHATNSRFSIWLSEFWKDLCDKFSSLFSSSNSWNKVQALFWLQEEPNLTNRSRGHLCRNGWSYATNFGHDHTINGDSIFKLELNIGTIRNSLALQVEMSPVTPQALSKYTKVTTHMRQKELYCNTFTSIRFSKRSARTSAMCLFLIAFRVLLKVASWICMKHSRTALPYNPVRKKAKRSTFTNH